MASSVARDLALHAGLVEGPAVGIEDGRRVAGHEELGVDDAGHGRGTDELGAIGQWPRPAGRRAPGSTGAASRRR